MANASMPVATYGWRAGCPAVGMQAKAIRSSHLFALVLIANRRLG
jgi:hypothetical protein